MKRLFALGLLLTLLLTGCSLFGERETESPLPSWYLSPTETGGFYPGAQDPALPREKSVVKTVLSYEGEIPLLQPTVYYSYQLPMIDLAGAQAMGCNQEIENRFGSLIRQSLEAMERYEEPILERVSYTSYTIKGILTLCISRKDRDGNAGEAWYTVDAETGEAVSVATLFEAVGVTEKPETAVNDALLALFTARYGAPQGADVSVTTALNRTQEALSPLTANRMHLTADGRLAVVLELFAPDGGSSVETLYFP